MSRKALPPVARGTVSKAAENASARVWSVAGADDALPEEYGAALISQGFTEHGSRTQGQNRYAAYRKGTRCVFLSYYGATCEMRVVDETHCRYFDFSCPAGAPRFHPQITQIALPDYGLSYTVRLSDGRFLVFDGGSYRDAYADALMEHLRACVPEGPIVIAGWILTHPHGDHMGCFLRFTERWADQVRIESVLFNAPEPDDFKHFPRLAKLTSVGCTTGEQVARVRQFICQENIPCFVPHTGQIYRFGGAVCEILASPDDTVGNWVKLNNCSLVIRMELAGQVVLWCADAQFSACRLAERFGSYLKADILQVTHHGFVGGTPECYDLIAPEVCLLPQSEMEYFSRSGIIRPEGRHLVRMPCLREMIVPTATRTIPLPYHAHPNGRRELDERIRVGQTSCGARTWFFTDLNTDTDRRVDVIVTTRHIPPELHVDLIYDEAADYMAARTTARPWSVTHIDLAELFDLPENRPFALRVFADRPVVVSLPGRTAAYFS